MQKAGSTHIVWVAFTGLDNNIVKEVESDLIEALNPIANTMRPAPPHTLQKVSRKVFGCLRSAIHENREEKYALKLV